LARSFNRPLPPPIAGESPVGPLPPIIVVLALGLAAVEGVLSLAGMGLVGGATGIGWRVGLIEQVAFSPAAWDALGVRGLDPALLQRLVAYPVVHYGPIETAFAVAMLLALGKFVAESMGQGRALLVLLVSTLAGAVAYGVALSGTFPLFGAFPAIYGLIGAYTFLLWVRIGAAGGNRLGAFRLIGVLLGLQLVFGAIFGANPTWVAEIGGFVAGGVTAALVVPGALAALSRRLRSR
jgi:rhomboid protease GluP